MRLRYLKKVENRWHYDHVRAKENIKTISKVENKSTNERKEKKKIYIYVSCHLYDKKIEEEREIKHI
jgi:hypothetical protein